MKCIRIHILKPYWRALMGGQPIQKDNLAENPEKLTLCPKKGGPRLTYIQIPTSSGHPYQLVHSVHHSYGDHTLVRSPSLCLISFLHGAVVIFITSWLAGPNDTSDCTRQGRIRMSISQNIYNGEVILSSLSGAPVSTVHVLSVCVVDLSLLQGGKVEEVRGPMDLVVEFLGVGQLQVILHVGVVANT